MNTTMDNPFGHRRTLHFAVKFVAWLIIVASILILDRATAQGLYVSVGTQKTIAGLQQGAEIGITLQNQVSFGAFYQSTDTFSFEEGIHNYPYVGGILQIPIKKSCNGIGFYGQVKAGLVNEQFIAITPQLETQIELTSFLKAAVNLGIRAGHSAVGARLIISL